MILTYGHKWNRWLITLVVMSAITTNSDTTAAVGAGASVAHCTKEDKCKVGEASSESQARYDYSRIYNVELASEEHVELLQKLEEKSDSLTFIGHAREVGQKLSILVSAQRVADFADLLSTYNIKHRILTHNFQEKIDKNLAEVLPIGTKLNLFDWKHYFHLETIYEWLEHTAEQYSNLVTLQDMGTSTQGVPIKGVKISHSSNNKTIFIESGIHAREWIAPATATYIINELLTSSDRSIQKLAFNYNWIIFPSVNPDGYKYTFKHDRMWRKNRQLFGICRGVDLNRNYPAHWNTTGSSSDPCRYDYAGPSAGSELETQRVIKYVKDHVSNENITAYIALHSYSQMLMFPYGHTREHIKNYDDLKEFGERASKRIKELSGRDYTSGCLIETIYPSSGGSMDWAYSETGIPIAYTFELRGPPDSEDLFILPAVEIEPTAQEAFAAIQTIIEGATEKGYFN